MRVLLDQELLTLKEAQHFLQVNRSTLNDMIDSGKLHAIKIGAQWKIEGWQLKNLVSHYHAGKFYHDFIEDSNSSNVSESELAMIADWT